MLVRLALEQFGKESEIETSMRAAVAALIAELTHEERDLIWREENRAWEIGERLLRERTFDDWRPFQEYRAVALRSHEVMLGRRELEPQDFEQARRRQSCAKPRAAEP